MLRDKVWSISKSVAGCVLARRCGTSAALQQLSSVRCCCCCCSCRKPCHQCLTSTVQLCYIHAPAVNYKRRPHSVLTNIRRSRCTHIFCCPHSTVVRVQVCSASTCFRAFGAARSSIAWMAYSAWESHPGSQCRILKLRARKKTTHPHHQGNEIHVVNTNALIRRCRMAIKRSCEPH